MRELKGTRDGTLVVDGNRDGGVAKITGDRNGLVILVSCIAEVLASGEPLSGTDAEGKQTLVVALTRQERER